MKILGTNNARTAASSLAHGVVMASSTTSEIETATRNTMSPAASRPCEVIPIVVPPATFSFVTLGNVVLGMKSHARRTKKPSGILDAAAIARRGT